MRRVPLILGVCGTLLGVAAFCGRTIQRSGDVAAPPSSAVSPGVEERDSPAVRELAVSQAVAVREQVSTPEHAAEDPCASLAAELRAERAARVAAEQEVARLRAELDRVTRELKALRFPESTPYGAFLASPEALDIRENISSGSHLYRALLDDARNDVRRYELMVAEDSSKKHSLEVFSERLQRLSTDREAAVDQVFGSIEAWLDTVPVMLHPGEATWIVERCILGPEGDTELIQLLGPKRAAAEIPLDMLLEDFLWDEDCGLDLQAALPPEKRAELDAKLDVLMKEAAGDPEEIAWLLERFPSFFD